MVANLTVSGLRLRLDPGGCRLSAASHVEFLVWEEGTPF